ncbi:MAG: hypothetical protein MUC89_12385 [Acetobacteraceae bacterium]|jgi:hypothetical protein|nr:hypothetical protein [Acetobacteraceae bacterium]
MAVTLALPARPGGAGAEPIAPAWAATAQRVAAEAAALAASAGEAGRGAVTSFGQGMVAFAEAARPAAARATDQAREVMRDPGLGPAIAGGLGLLAGLALGVQAARRRAERGMPLVPEAAAAIAPAAPPAHAPLVPPAPPAPAPMAERARATPPALPAAPLLAGTVPHAHFAPEPEPAPERLPHPVAAPRDERAALIDDILRILAEEAAASPEAHAGTSPAATRA